MTIIFDWRIGDRVNYQAASGKINGTIVGIMPKRVCVKLDGITERGGRPWIQIIKEPYRGLSYGEEPT